MNLRTHRLACTECGTVTEDDTGWRALLAVGDERTEKELEVAVYGPKCAEREFDSA